MRILLLMRGAPGCGKSTFIDTHGLRPYALSADEIRLQCQSAQQTVSGLEAISQSNERVVWKVLFQLLEIRMEKGEFTVIDATNSKTEEMNRYKQMAQSYRYRMFCVDFTDLPIEECKARNAGRIPLKQVPEEAIDKMYARFKNQKIPGGIKAIKPDELDTIWLQKRDMSQYRKIVHIGDVHGCYTALKEYLDTYNTKYFKDEYLISEDIMFIFCGDYVDRGIENAQVVNFLIEASKKKNVLLLEGNHERWLWIYANGGTGRSKEFELVTRKQLDEECIDLKDLRQLYRKFGQCAWYNYHGKEVFVSHAGIATLPPNLSFMATDQMIHGVGGYNDSDAIAETWMRTSGSNSYQIHGHRNIKKGPMKTQDRVYNLEGDIEHGGHLRILELSEDGFNEIEIKNNVFKEVEVIKEEQQVQSSSVADAVMAMRRDKANIIEKNFGHISSFNFTKEVFRKKNWTNRSIKARGLYIDIDKMKVAGRSYDKFFNVDERPETKLSMLKYTMEFPVTCYVKENGFLGLVSYDEYGDYEDNLLVTTKASITGDFSVWLREMLNKKLSPEKRQEIANYCKENDVTFVFECVDMGNDPHIIDYPESELFLLTIVDNDLEFNQVDYSELCEIGEKFGIKVKEKAYVINNWADFYDWYTEVTAEDYKWNDRIIEGFVIEDSKGFMTKLKLDYYNFWKHMRNIAHGTLRKGYITQTGQLYNALANEFYAFCQKLYNSVGTREEREAFPRDIVNLRRMFYKDKN